MDSRQQSIELPEPHRGSTLSEEDRTWGSRGGCFLVALALQGLTKGQLVGILPQYWDCNSDSAIPGMELKPVHAYVEISEWLVDVAGARKRDELEAVFDGASRDMDQRFSLVSLTPEEVEALAASAAAVNSADSSDSRERATRIAKQLREDIRDV